MEADLNDAGKAVRDTVAERGRVLGNWTRCAIKLPVKRPPFGAKKEAKVVKLAKLWKTSP